MREFNLDKVLCDIWGVWKKVPGRPFTINQEQWDHWEIDEQTCKEVVLILIRRQLLEPAGPEGFNVTFPRLVTLTEKGLSHCQRHCGS